MMEARIARMIEERSRRRTDGPLGARSRLVATWGATALTLVPLLAWSPVLPAAEASPTSCVSTGLGSLCSQADNSGLHVGEVRAWLSGPTRSGKPGEQAWICNKELKVRGTLADSRSYERSAVAQCGWDRVFVRFSVDQDFRDGDHVCVAVREHGPQNPWEPYEACTRIRR